MIIQNFHSVVLIIKDVCLIIDFHAMNYLFHNKEFLDEKFEVTKLTNQIKNNLFGGV